MLSEGSSPKKRDKKELEKAREDKSIIETRRMAYEKAEEEQFRKQDEEEDDAEIAKQKSDT